MSLIKPVKEDVLSFLSFVDFLPNGCWFWQGGRSRGKNNKKFYGSFWVPSLKTTVRAHRYASEVFNCEECSPGHHRDHTCHFSLCVCPAHIEVVPREVNQERKRPKGEDFACLLSRFGLESLLTTEKALSNEEVHRPQHPEEALRAERAGLYLPRTACPGQR